MGERAEQDAEAYLASRGWHREDVSIGYAAVVTHLAAYAAERETAARKRAKDRAYRIAYAPLRSAQHALAIIADNQRNWGSARSLAMEESKRIGEAIIALSPRTEQEQGG